MKKGRPYCDDDFVYNPDSYRQNYDDVNNCIAVATVARYNNSVVTIHIILTK